ncbi:adenine deaminase [Anaerovorax odorimutans]|uniref:adenine deaminase n=1 Tax=Anaerovorax odorimutans TaxID=109327 RepID=UPI00041E9F37|nr:adenine deaminase [Anaerovorax odorimutans]
MEKKQLKKLIDIAAGRIPADMVIKNCKVVDVYSGNIIEGDIAMCEGLIAGVGKYEGLKETDAEGQYAAPGFIDSHIHVESSYVSPEELGRLIVPHGTTTIIADPHEITNVCGLGGLNYMIEASKKIALDIKWMLPSCVPATPFEHAGAIINAEDMEEPIKNDNILGLGEFMNFPGVIGADEGVLDKILVSKRQGKPIDGHSPGISGNALNAYASARIHTDHECSTVDEMNDRIARGMYVLLRQGSACHNLKVLIKGITPFNSRRCLFCADDCQPKTILSMGHIDNHLRICVEEGINPITAIQMASLNAAECFGLDDRGAIAPGLRADIALFDNLKDFNVQRVFIEGKEAASQGCYKIPVKRHDISKTKGSFHVKDFSKEKLKLNIKSDKANVINILPGGVVTSKETEEISRDENGDFVYTPSADIVKVAVVERHQNTGNVAVALLKGYGIKEGAVALSIAHDSHNIIVVGVNDEDMAFGVEELIKQDGGIVLVKDRKIIASMPLPIAGLMSDQSGEWVDEKLTHIHEAAHDILKINEDVEPVMTLCFMSLAVIPEIKLTDMGLFDVTKFEFINIEA